MSTISNIKPVDAGNKVPSIYRFDRF